MPTYQYVCTECGDQIEAVQKFTDDPLTVHDACGGRLRKVFSPVGIVFKGSGFYRTDSRNGSSAKEPAGSSASGDASASGDKKGSDGDKGGEKKDSKPAGKAAPAAASSSSSSSSSGGSAGGSAGEKVA